MTRPALLSIGAFSNATQLSAKALRLYADYGILVPAHIDADTGYRYYRPDQVAVARQVRLLREIDLPLAQIATLVANGSDMAGAAYTQLKALARRYSRQQAAYRDLLALLSAAPDAHREPIGTRMLAATDVRVLDFEAGPDSLVARAKAVLARAPGSSEHKQRAFIPLQAGLVEDEEGVFTLCLPVDAPIEDSSKGDIRHWPATIAACIAVGLRDGSPDFAAASDALFDWFDRQGYSLNGTPRLYFHGPAFELAWPIN